MSWDSDDYRQKRENNQKHRWTQAEINKDLAEKVGATYQGDHSTWIFDLNGKKVHFYPTKNWWRFANSDHGDPGKGGFRKFWKWYQSNQGQVAA